jgi:uncharacterized membrane protein
MFGACWWWILPLGMMIFCFLMMWGRKGGHLCGFGAHDAEHADHTSDTALDILEKQYAGGAIDKEEYEEKRNALTQKGEDNE